MAYDSAESRRKLVEFFTNPSSSSGIPSTGNQNAKKVFSTIPTSPIYNNGMTSENTGQRFSNIQANQQKNKAKKVVDDVITKNNTKPSLSSAGAKPTVKLSTPATAPVKASTPAPVQKSQTYLDMLQGLMKSLPEDDPQTKAIKDAATKEYQNQMQGYDRRINELQSMQGADLSSLRQTTDLAQKQLEDKMFQQYLQTRENMGIRGLANSGLMADAQIRLGMNKQDALANLFAKTQEQINQINKQYMPTKMQLMTERGNLTQESIEQKMMEQTNAERAKRAESFAKLLPYYELTADQKADLEMQQNRLNFDMANKASQGGKSGVASMGDSKLWDTLAGDLTKDIDDAEKSISRMDENNPNRSSEVNRYYNLINAREAARNAASALRSGDMVAFQRFSKMYEDSVRPQPSATPTVKVQADIAKFPRLVDLGTNIYQNTPGVEGGYLYNDTNPAEMLRRALEIAKSTGQTVQIPSSRWDQITRYAQGQTNKFDTARGFFRGLPNVKNVGTLMTNARNIMNMLQRYPGLYTIVPDAQE